MRPKYSSPGAEELNSSHCRCAHLLFVAPQTSFDAAFVGEPEGLGVVVAVGEAFGVAAAKRTALAAASATDSVDSVRFTFAKLLSRRARGLLAGAMRGAPTPSRTTRVMARSIRVAAAQLAAHDRTDFPAALEAAIVATRHACSDADVVVMPEGTIPAYVLGRAALDWNEVDVAIARLRDLARETRTVIVAGAAAAVEGRARNGAVVIDADGSPAGRADKFFLWHFDRRWFEPGDRIAPIATRAGSLGVLVCADGRLPTIARALVDRGAEILVMPTAWVTSGRDPSALENVQADLLARVRAYENGVPFVAANKCGSELGMVAYCGKSQIVDARGEIVALASETQPETLHATVALGDAGPRRGTPPAVTPRARTVGDTLRVAISFDPLPDDIAERLALLDGDYAIAPHEPGRLAMLDGALGAAEAGDETVLDPGGLVAYRRAGYALICWTSALPAPWLERVARARALELRLYVIVFDRAQRRAFAVDPDGAIVAGTFGEYRLASFSLAAAKTAQTAVAPGTDVAAGLERVAAALGGPA